MARKHHDGCSTRHENHIKETLIAISVHEDGPKNRTGCSVLRPCDLFYISFRYSCILSSMIFVQYEPAVVHNRLLPVPNISMRTSWSELIRNPSFADSLVAAVVCARCQRNIFTPLSVSVLVMGQISTLNGSKNV